MRLPSMALFVLVCLLSASRSRGQFTEPLTFGDNANENAYHLISDRQGGFYVAGTIDGAFAPLDDPLPLFGQEDVFLGQINASGQWQWAKSCGSFLNDEIRVVRQMPDGGLILAGTYWLEFSYGDLQLNTTDNIKGIFIVRTDAQGNSLWGKSINGSDLKEVNDLKVGPEGNLYLTGHFSEVLQFDNLRLEARGDNDGFLLQLDPDGNLTAWKQVGNKGTTRGQTIALHPSGGYYWGGVYNDTLMLDQAELYANTFDRDVFLSRYDASGELLWAQRAGGVFEEELIAMETDPQGRLYATGFLIGVMSLSETLSIQSRNGNPDIFLFSYDPEGNPLWARAIGGDLIDLPTDLCLRADELIIGGTYQQQMAWDDLSTPATGGVNGYIAGFDPMSGSGNWLAPVSTENFAFVEALETDQDGTLFALGSFTGTARLGAFQISSPMQYNGYLTSVDPALTAIASPTFLPGLRLFPNPVVNDQLQLENTGGESGLIQIFDGAGRKWLERYQPVLSVPMQVNDLPPGIYWLVIRQGRLQTARPFVIVRP